MLVNERPRDRHFPEFDNETSLREARSRRPLERVLEELGHHPGQGASWKSFTCPHCHKKNKAGLFDHTDGTRMFKCHSTKCPTGAQAMDEVGYIAYCSSLNRKDAFQVFLKDAGVWEERTKYQAKPAVIGEDAEWIEKCIALVRSEQRASVSLLQRRLGMGYTRAARIMDELERRGIVGPAKGAEPREVLMEPLAGTPSPQPSPQGEGAGAAPPPTNLVPFPAGDNAPTTPVPAAPVAATPSAVEATAPPVPVGSPQNLAGTVGFSQAQSNSPERELEGEAEPDDESGLTALRKFYALTSLGEQDEAVLFHKRGLTTETSRALGFRSNPKSNTQLLVTLANQSTHPALLGSGLFRRKDQSRTIKPSAIFYGWGRTKKKSKDELAREAEEKHMPIDKVNEWHYGWTHQPLIPYVDVNGEIIGLRPHKDMAMGGTISGTPRLYIPRRLGVRQTEKFPVVVLTEGEFKAAALWQIVGAGNSALKEPIGVAAVPGITFARNMESSRHVVREELDQWLRAVRCRKLVVVYDNEDKSCKPEKSRHDPQIWARVLAEDIYRKLHIISLVGHLPDGWRDQKGKADWDGALARFVSAGHATPVEATSGEEDDVPFEAVES